MSLVIGKGLERVDRHLVHRAAQSEVYLVNSQALTSTDFVMEAQWPRRHYLFDMESGQVDLLLAAETLRQATILVAHRYFDVPMTASFLMRGLSIEATGTELPQGFSPFEIQVALCVSDVRQGSRGLTALQTKLSFYYQDALIAKGSGDLQILEARLYRRMRPSARSSHELPALPASHELPRGVSLLRREDQPFTWNVGLDHRHPVFFDHPLDHVPGMAIIEAVAQVAADLLGSTVSLRSFSGVFEAFLELGEPVTIQVLNLQDTLPDQNSMATNLTMAVHQRGATAVRVCAS